MKSGFISVIGRPNVGKSTLVNSFIGKHIAITSDKPQTTRNNIQGIYHDPDYELIFIDTPGIHKPKNKLGRILNSQAYFTISDADVVLLVMDVTERLGTGDRFVIDKLKTIDKPVILILNKIDKIPKEEILKKIDEYKDLFDFNEIVPVSALKHDNLDRLLSTIKKYINDSMKYYNDDQITDKSREFIIAEYIREKILDLTNDEVPHLVTCVVEGIKENNYICEIDALIIVERESLKKIIIGKNGSMIKEIGTRARIDIEKLVEKKVFLKLFVKVVSNWRDKEKYLIELGFKSNE
jgi:GTP-binding protein Era